MHQKRLILLIGCISFAVPVFSQQPITATPVDPSLIATPPFSYNGRLLFHPQQGPLTASGSIIGEGILAIAGSIAYDEENDYWIPASTIHYYPRYNNLKDYPVEERYMPVAFYKWEEYSSRVKAFNGSNQDFADRENLDFAVGYFSAEAEDEFLLQHPELNVDEEGGVSVLRQSREKMVIAYPRDIQPEDTAGLMHLIPPNDYTILNIFDVYAGINEHDSGGYPVAEYYLENAILGAGSGGAPIYVRDDMDNWMMSGIIHGAQPEGTLLRAIDENAYYDNVSASTGMIQQAIAARNGDALMRVEDLDVVLKAPGSVELSWADASSQETGYSVFRQETGSYEEIAVLSADSNTYVDDTVLPGHVYHYRVQPYKDLANPYHRNKAPKSRQAAIEIPGIHPGASSFPGADLLHIRSSGDSSWFIDEENKLRAGGIYSMGSTSLILDIIGPGTLSFDWSASCEENPDYATPGAQHEGYVYDAVWLYMDDEKVMTGDEPVFLSGPSSDDSTGLTGPVNMLVSVPEGIHKIEWRYAKDPYANEHRDTAFLDALSWHPDPATPYPVYGAYSIEGTEWHDSQWFGMYNVQHMPWVYHEDLGWLYLQGGTTGKGAYFYCNDSAQCTLYTSPDCWPFLYQPQSGSWYYHFVGSNHIVLADP